MCLVVDIGCGCVCVWVSFLNIHWLYSQVDEMVMQTYSVRLREQVPKLQEVPQVRPREQVPRPPEVRTRCHMTIAPPFPIEGESAPLTCRWRWRSLQRCSSELQQLCLTDCEEKVWWKKVCVCLCVGVCVCA
jgi:hypothetical protein